MDNDRHWFHISWEGFDINLMDRQNVSCMLDAYSRLESLTLVIDEGLDGSRRSLDRKPNWIRLCMPGLRVLSVTPTCHWRHLNARGTELLQFDMFEHWSCPHLSHVSLHGISFTKNQLLRFLETHALQSLTLGELRLDGHYWVSTLDAIWDCVQKPRHIGFLGPLHVHEDWLYWNRLIKEVDGLKEKIEFYLHYGGVNPLPR